MIRKVNRDQILAKMSKFLDSAFGTPAPDHFVFVEVGESKEYDRIHIQKAVFLDPEQIERADFSWLAGLGSEVILYSDEAHQSLCRSVAQILSTHTALHIYLYAEGKEDWISNGLWIQSTLVAADGLDSQLRDWRPPYPELKVA